MTGFRLIHLRRYNAADHPAASSRDQAEHQHDRNGDDQTGLLLAAIVFCAFKVSHGSRRQIGERMSTSC
jgi:hypothetical protein